MSLGPRHRRRVCRRRRWSFVAELQSRRRWSRVGRGAGRLRVGVWPCLCACFGLGWLRDEGGDVSTWRAIVEEEVSVGEDVEVGGVFN